MSNTEKYIKLKSIWFVIAFTACLTGLFLFRYNWDTDNLWHLLMGRDVLRNMTVSYDNTYSWITGTHWNQHEWLYDVILYAFTNTLGSAGYFLVFAIIQIILMNLAYNYNKEFFKYKYFMMFVFLEMLIAYYVRTGMNRPSHISGLLLVFALLHYFNNTDYKKVKYYVLYFVLGILTANMHGGSFMAIDVLFVLLIGLDIFLEYVASDGNKTKGVKNLNLGYKLLGVLIFNIGLLLNPSGYHLLFDIFVSFKSESTSYISEWMPFSVGSLIDAITFVFVIITIGYALGKHNWEKKHLMIIAILCAFLCLSLHSKRNLVQFSYFMSVFGVRYMAEMLFDFIGHFSKPEDWSFGFKVTNKGIFAGIILSFSLCMVGACFMTGNCYYFEHIDERINETYLPDELCDHLLENPQDRLLHGYSTGNCLMWNDIPVFVDSRQHPYVKENGDCRTMDDYILMHMADDVSEIDAIFETYDFTAVITNDLDLDIAWYMEQRDDFECIYSHENIDITASPEPFVIRYYVKIK